IRDPLGQPFRRNGLGPHHESAIVATIDTEAVCRPGNTEAASPASAASSTYPASVNIGTDNTAPPSTRPISVSSVAAIPIPSATLVRVPTADISTASTN